MRNLDELKKYRVDNTPLGPGDASGGVFAVPVKSRLLKVIASNGKGWDHVSVSLVERCPTWEEMDAVRHLFFKPEEVVIQIHPAVKNHINACGTCLHLWRPRRWWQRIPLPPLWMIGPRRK